VNDAQSTIVGLKAQDCPGGGWAGMPAELEGKATVADCLSRGVCGCIYGDAVQHIEQLQHRSELAEAELEALNHSHRDLAKRLADAGRKALAESQ
jgi:hypothetical protein